MKSEILLPLVILFFFPLLIFGTIKKHKIWEGNKYAAFTSIVDYQGCLYCAFREANYHADISGKDNGVIRIIRSKKGITWETDHVFSLNNVDLRDPKLSVMPNGELMLLTESVTYFNGETLQRKSCSAFMDNGKWSEISPINIEPDTPYNWLWDIGWGDEEGFGFTYIPDFSLLKTTDGKNYQVVYKYSFEDRATETSTAIFKNKLYAVVRNENSSYIGYATTDNPSIWHWKRLEYKLGCPELQSFDKLYLVAKRYTPIQETVLFSVDESSLELSEMYSIEGSKDFSYPGIVKRGKYFFISYYLGDGKNSSIYLSILKEPYSNK